jgi:ubiquinone biosynthesis O-methyltransferase
MNTFDYESYPGYYQYEALNSRNPVQRFWHQKKLEFVKAKLGSLDGQKVLDAGCGSGHLCFALADSCKEVIGIDISYNAIEFAQNTRKKLNVSNVTFIKTERDSFPFPSESFDVVIMMELIEHLENPTILLTEALRVLKRRCRLFITTPTY